MLNFKLQKNLTLFARIIIYPLFILVLSACNISPEKKPNVGGTIALSSTYTLIPTAIVPSESFAPTINSTQISTPVAPLIAHEWTPIEPLIAFGGYGGDGPQYVFDSAIPPHFTLLSSGSLFIFDWNYDLEIFEMKSTTLSRQGICYLLNSIDQTGFFEYDPLTYIRDPQKWRPPVAGVGHYQISVQAWKSNSIDFFGLGYFIHRLEDLKNGLDSLCCTCPGYECPTILPSIQKVFQLLVNYHSVNLEIYQSDRIGVWIDTYYEDQENSVAWPFPYVKLSKIVTPNGYQYRADPNIILTGANAQTVYQLFNQSINVSGINFTEGDKIYRVFARPLMPNEYLTETPTPSTPLSCNPSDGWVEIP